MLILRKPDIDVWAFPANVTGMAIQFVSQRAQQWAWHAELLSAMPDEAVGGAILMQREDYDEMCHNLPDWMVLFEDDGKEH